MYLTSGHLPYYADSMFPPMALDEVQEKREALSKKLSYARWSVIDKCSELEVAQPDHNGVASMLVDYLDGPELSEQKKIDWAKQAVANNVGDEAFKSAVHEYAQLESELEKLPGIDRYYLKAMNCPHHHKLFGAVPRSYRDLPLRFAEYGTCYRYEQSGELQGLMRVRAMQMNDAHIYCSEEQFASEFNAVNQMYLNYFKLFGFSKYQMRFSTHDPAKLGEKFLDNPELWKKTEDMVRDVLITSNIPYVEVPNEAAFYGPKIDVQIWSAIGREFTIATNQVDFGVPARFGLHYKTRENTDAVPLCIHRAPLGTHERFIGFLIEHYAGNFPLWLAPEQVRVLPIGDEPALVDYARAVQTELRAAGVRATLDATNDPIKAKIADAEKFKVHTMLVIGGRDLEAGNVSVRVHGKGNLGAKPRGEVIADLLASVKERRA